MGRAVVHVQRREVRERRREYGTYKTQSGLGFQVKAFKTFKVVPFWHQPLGAGRRGWAARWFRVSGFGSQVPGFGYPEMAGNGGKVERLTFGGGEARVGRAVVHVQRREVRERRPARPVNFGGFVSVLSTFGDREAARGPSFTWSSVYAPLSSRREQLKTFEGVLPGSQGQNRALTVLHVPDTLDSGQFATRRG